MRRGSCKSYSITFCSPGRGYTHVYKQRIKSVHSVGMALMCRMFGLHLQHGGLDRGCEIEPCEIRMRVYIHTGLRCVCSPFFLYQTVSGILTIEKNLRGGCVAVLLSPLPVHQPLQSENHTPPPINNSSSQTSSSPFLSPFFVFSIIDFLPKNSNLTSPGKTPPSTKSCRIQVQRQ